MTHGVAASVNPLSLPFHGTGARSARAGLRETGPALPGGMARGACHELYAARGLEAAAAAGLSLALALELGGSRPLLLLRHEELDREAGVHHAPGLVEFGLDPAGVMVVRARDPATLLQAGLEGVRCAGLGAVVLALWGETRLYDLTASRRLALAARGSNVPLLMLRLAAAPQPSAAETRWRVQAAPSRALPANAPGHPAFLLTLLRHRHGLQAGAWRLEWNRDDQHLDCRPLPDAVPLAVSEPAPAPLSGTVVPLPADRPDSPAGAGHVWRQAG